MEIASIIVVQKRTGRVFTILVDQKNYERLSQYKWFITNKGAHKGMEKYYAQRNVPGRRGETKLMHRDITDAPPGTVVDHKDGDGLHNWEDNFIVTTQPDNARRQIKKTQRRTYAEQ